MLMLRPPPRAPLFPYTTLFRSAQQRGQHEEQHTGDEHAPPAEDVPGPSAEQEEPAEGERIGADHPRQDRKSTRLNSSHVKISYAVFCLKKKKKLRKNVDYKST